MTFSNEVQIVGRDADGDKVAKADHGYGATYYLLTPCCEASGKGSADSPTGVVCRACYETVDAKFGDGWGEGDDRPLPMVESGSLRKPDPPALARSFARLIGEPKLAAEVEADIRTCCNLWPDAMAVVPFVTREGALAYEVTRYRNGGGIVRAENLGAAA